MPIEIEDPELEAKIAELALKLGVTPEEAVCIAVRHQAVADGIIAPDNMAN